jgi:hypothetical protein
MIFHYQKHSVLNYSSKYLCIMHEYIHLTNTDAAEEVDKPGGETSHRVPVHIHEYTHLTNTDATEEVDKPGGETRPKHGVAGVPVPGHHIRSTGHQFRGKILQTEKLFTVLQQGKAKSFKNIYANSEMYCYL